MNVIIDGTGHDEPIKKQNNVDGVPRVGEGVLIWGELYVVSHVIWDYDKDEVVVEVSDKGFQ